MNTDLSSITKPLKQVAKLLGRYRGILFFLFIAAVYGFIVYRIQVLSTASPDQSSVAQASTATPQPHIDPSVVDKIQKLQDNSVNVQSLFKKTRDNPFQE